MNGQNIPRGARCKAFYGLLAPSIWENLAVIRTRLQWILISAAIVLLATALRLCGAMNDLWLDEVWSLKLACAVASPLDIFTKIHHDNSHYLNSLWLYFLGPHRNPIWYRMPSILAGAGMVVVAGLIGRRRNPAAGLFAMLLTALSYPLVLYGSEARGYSFMVFFSFLAFYALDCYLEKPDWRYAALFSVSAILGLLSHLTFINVLIASICWCWWRMRSVRDLIQCCAAPCAVFAVLYVVDVRHLVEGGGGLSQSLGYTYASAMAWALGAPTVYAFPLTTIIVCAAFYLTRRDSARAFVFFVAVIVVVPLLLTVVRNSPTLFVRYFLPSMVFVLILAAWVLAALFYKGGVSRIAAIVLLIAFAALNGFSTCQLLKFGRGHYQDAIRFIASHTRGKTISIDSDNNFQVPLMLDYYADALGGKPMEYHRDAHEPWGPEWIICQKDSLEDRTPPHGQFIESAGVRYELVEAVPTAPLSGLQWFIWHALPQTPGPASGK
jgi:hypothetical protein